MSKEKYCTNILRYYSILVEYEGNEDKLNVPLPLEEPETFAHWRQRVLGNDVSDVKVYMPIEFQGKTLISTIQNKIDSRHIANIFNNLRKEKNGQIKVAIEEAVIKNREIFTTFPIDTLEEIVEDLEFTLEEPVNEFLEKYIQDNSEVKTEELIEKLLKLYNDAVHEFRVLRNKNQPPSEPTNDET